MMRPTYFKFNPQTAGSNKFQKEITIPFNASKTVQHEFDAAVNTLIKNDIDVMVCEDAESQSPDAIFVNNWIVQLPEGSLSIFPLLAPNRRKEVRMSVIEKIKQRTLATQLLDVREIAETNQFLEGTGSIVFDHFSKTAFACESERTNIALFERYCKQVGYTPFSFESVDLNGFPIYHTNVMLSIASAYAVINLNSIENQLEKSFCKAKLERLGKEIIAITYQQMAKFAGNVFEVQNKKGHSHLIMSATAYKNFLPDQLKQIEQFSSIVQVDIPIIEKIGGGSIRCMLAGLFV